MAETKLEPEGLKKRELLSKMKEVITGFVSMDRDLAVLEYRDSLASIKEAKQAIYISMKKAQDLDKELTIIWDQIVRNRRSVDDNKPTAEMKDPDLQT